GVASCDVSGQVTRKIEALSAYRSQFPLEPDMFPGFLLREMFGCEYFVAAPTGRPAHLDETPPGPVLEPELSAPPPARKPGWWSATTRGKGTPGKTTQTPGQDDTQRENP